MDQLDFNIHLMADGSAWMSRGEKFHTAFCPFTPPVQMMRENPVTKQPEYKTQYTPCGSGCPLFSVSKNPNDKTVATVRPRCGTDGYTIKARVLVEKSEEDSEDTGEGLILLNP